MITRHASTALALLFALGVLGTTLPGQTANSGAPSEAHGDADRGSKGDADRGDEGNGGDDGDPGDSDGPGDPDGSGGPGEPGGPDTPGAEGSGQAGGPGATGGEMGAVHPLVVSAVRPELVVRCDRDGDGLIDIVEARACGALRLGRLLDDTNPVVGQQVATAAPGARPEAGYVPMLFDRIDLDGDGAITREEWLRWRDGDATEVTGDTAAAR